MGGVDYVHCRHGYYRAYGGNGNMTNKACPFCGSQDVDPEGWLDGNGRRGPECLGCGATAPSLSVWDQRATEGLTACMGQLLEIREAYHSGKKFRGLLLAEFFDVLDNSPAICLERMKAEWQAEVANLFVTFLKTQGRDDVAEITAILAQALDRNVAVKRGVL